MGRSVGQWVVWSPHNRPTEGRSRAVVNGISTQQRIYTCCPPPSQLPDHAFLTVTLGVTTGLSTHLSRRRNQNLLLVVEREKRDGMSFEGHRGIAREQRR